MRSEKLVPGLILVGIGVIFLLDNYNVIDFHWNNLFHLWPMFLIMAGVNLLLVNNKTAWASALKIGVVVLGFGILIFAHTPDTRFWTKWDKKHHGNNWNWNYDDDDHDDEDNDSTDTVKQGLSKVSGASTYNEPFKPGTVEARLEVNGGGTEYILKDTTSQLFEAATKESFTRFNYEHSMDGTIPVVALRMKDKKGHIQWDSDNTNSATMKLNAKAVWNINVKAGATKVDFDLSKFRVRNLNMNGGAGSFEVKMGMPVSQTRIEVATGVSEVDIKVPEGAAVQITTSTGLSSNNFPGFEDKGNSHYETPNFATATNKMYIVMKGGLSDFKVSRY